MATRRTPLREARRSPNQPLVTQGSPETGMKREVRCKTGAAPATVTGEASATMPLEQSGKAADSDDPASQETCQALPLSGAGGVHRHGRGTPRATAVLVVG